MSAAVSLSDHGSSNADTIRGTRPPTPERKVEVVDAVDENGFTNMEKVETIRPRVRTGVDFDDYFVSPPWLPRRSI